MCLLSLSLRPPSQVPLKYCFFQRTLLDAPSPRRSECRAILGALLFLPLADGESQMSIFWMQLSTQLGQLILSDGWEILRKATSVYSMTQQFYS